LTLHKDLKEQNSILIVPKASLPLYKTLGRKGERKGERERREEGGVMEERAEVEIFPTKMANRPT
jgi:hypothetical protein